MSPSSTALLPRSSVEERDSLTQPLPGSRTVNPSRREEKTRLFLKIPTWSPLLSLTAMPEISVPTPAKPTTNSEKLSIPPKSSLKSPPKSKKDHQTPASRSVDPSALLPSSVETPNLKSAGPRTAKTSMKMITSTTTLTEKPPSSPSPTSPRRMLANTKSTAKTTKDSTTPSPPLPLHNFFRFVIHSFSSFAPIFSALFFYSHTLHL